MLGFAAVGRGVFEFNREEFMLCSNRREIKEGEGFGRLKESTNGSRGKEQEEHRSVQGAIVREKDKIHVSSGEDVLS